MEIVLNKCYGGFGLSNAAEDLYAKKSGFKLYRYDQTEYRHSGGKDLYKKVSEANESMFSYTFKVDQGDSFSEWPKGKDTGYWYSHDIERTDPILIEVVKELGDKANGRCAKLEIIDIPSDINYEIDEYDGIESVHETHRSW